MPGKRSIDRRTLLLRSGLAVTAMGTALAAVPAQASATDSRRVEAPHIYDTGNWQARPPREPITLLNHPPTYIVVHHTVEPGNTDDYSLDRAFAISRSIQNFHMDSNGWIDTGQQFTISRGGYITEGRHRSLEALTGGTQHVLGANVANHNSEVIGIENEGLYMEVDVPQTLWDSLVSLVAYIASQYNISPEMIRGHRDFNSTACPGDVLYARLPELRQAVADRLGVSFREPGSTPLLRPGDRSEDVLLAQRRLRAHGYDVPAHGVFDQATREAVAAFAASNGLAQPTCQACAHTEERGYLGRDVWELLTPR
ncbi:peptidoglycan recognition protein family protein [Saccharomonospora viridis]|jgi:N-acetyl-anhydromuramyl-L-alanine amidase AmpD|uniref:Negative regulator of beta-lactamase expression n=2 Tax=Saccharomonospora viridis TaxID=1852 RepID=C7MQ69_SACVD|nr:N-acetylmuramoyl-L-alanine amidase [Saccharomonospora viridis]ACU98492.1 negative regulator of beta-lactamase expression [Saccharomonospora viridis DSM 43017]KHF44285.1 negative regulator of beta-lactamase expression [Saccharomonospora viridis]SFP61052.1 Putative peptidoglycan binding domain-containing protein [Saccharomonospora viridis]